MQDYQQSMIVMSELLAIMERNDERASGITLNKELLEYLKRRRKVFEDAREEDVVFEIML